MAKLVPIAAKPMKCLPGVVCVENYTLFLLVIFLGIALYMLYVNTKTPDTNGMRTHPALPHVPMHEMAHATHPHMSSSWLGGLSPIATRQVDVMTDLYAPPLKMDMPIYPVTGDIRGVVPINVKTRGFDSGYRQVGILTRKNGGDDLILPLMGTRIDSRDKWNYFTLSNTGSIQTKLPVSVAGKSCTSEYGCNEIYDGDSVYVDGYKDVFTSSIYESGLFRYLPAL